MNDPDKEEKRKEYRREWQRKNREKVKQYKLDGAIREVIAEINEQRKINPLETFTAKELSTMEFQQTDPQELAARLLACDSVVTKDGEWKYDKVPASLVQSIIDYFQSLT